jgi:hypothetical protein
MDIKELYELKLNHDEKGDLKNAFGIDDEEDKKCLDFACKTRKESRCMSEEIEKVWNCDTLSLNARIYTIFKIAGAHGYKTGLRDAAGMTAKLLGHILK